ncbi:MAG: aspartate carbamoyltransferase catalytic subunit [Bacillota bacterium]|nr:aspartate carbamoyltransferase catalytic subunit [Bacillota bacterium]
MATWVETRSGVGRHFLGVRGLEREALAAVLGRAAQLKRAWLEGEPLPQALAGRTVATLFFEPSTRTRNSFLQAAQLLGGLTLTVEAESSSVRKGETLEDTVRTLEAVGVEVMVLRHPESGAALRAAAAASRLAVLNAGDGMHEHPSQALLDVMTLAEHFGGARRSGELDLDVLRGLRLLILGDIAHSRVARSDIWALTTLGARLWVSGPATLLGWLPEEVRRVERPEEVLGQVDAVMALRLQRERMADGLVPSEREFRQRWGMTADRVRLLPAHAVVLHPAPVNRNVELDDSVMDSDRSLVFQQARNGVAVRMALLERAVEGEDAR